MPARYIFLIFSLLLAIDPSVSLAEVEVRDVVLLEGKSVTLSARTGGRLFSKGGGLVEFFIDDRSLGRTLSGGDGMAYMQIPEKGPGLYDIKASWGDYEDSGLMLVVEAGAPVLLVDVAGSLFKDLIGKAPREGALEAIRALSARFRVIYLHSRIYGLKAVRSWLVENGFLGAPVIAFRGGNVVRRLSDLGLNVEALVTGSSISSTVAGSAPGSGSKDDVRVLSFTKAKGAELVSSWADVHKSFEQR